MPRIGYGFGFSRRGSGGGVVDPLAPTAPTLTWDGVATDTTPNFDVGLPGGAAPGAAAVADDLVIQYSADSGANWSAYLTDPLDAGDIAGSPLTETGVTPLAGGSYTFRARLVRGAHVSAWSASAAATVTANRLSYYFLGF